MKKYIYLVTIAVALFACKEKNPPIEEPEEPQEPKDTIVVTPPSENENTIANYFITPVAWNGNFTEITNAMIITNSRKANAPTLANDEAVYPIYDIDPKDGTWPVVVTVNYGDSAIGADGLQHGGIMRIHATNFFEAEGSVITPSFDNFQCYGAVLSGSQTITNTGKNDAGNLVFDVTIANGTLEQSREFVYSEHTLRELVGGLGENGFLVPELAAHRYSITGQMKMQSSVDSLPGYEINIDSIPMLISVGDLYPTAGFIRVTLDKPISYKMNEAGFQGTVSIQTAELQFTGKTERDTYGVRITVYLQMGILPMPMTIQCELNEGGPIPETIQYIWNQ